ncbi:potassium channel family protein [Sphingomonas glacialis]|nr:potassium channel family protein [Sphingomonas glacialis]
MASIMVGLSVIVHFAGLSMLLALVQRHRRGADRMITFIENGAVMAGAALGLFALHGIEIWGYAFLYRAMGWFETFEQALYFSTSTYATIGYGDVVLPVGSRLLGAIEGVNGVILLGWSTAFFFTIVHRMTSIERDFGRGPASLHPDTVQLQRVRDDGER